MLCEVKVFFDDSYRRLDLLDEILARLIKLSNHSTDILEAGLYEDLKKRFGPKSQSVRTARNCLGMNE